MKKETKEKLLWALAGIGAAILTMVGITYANKTDKVITKAVEDITVSESNDKVREETVEELTKHQEEIKVTVAKVEKDLKVTHSKISVLQQKVADRKAREKAAKKEKKDAKK